jgi:dTDP-4-amino-4,6-dideoxygalactose transaminase
MLAVGYIKPLYLEPIFAEREKFRNGYPYRLLSPKDRPDYSEGICPVTERLYRKELIVTSYHYPPLATTDMDDIVKAFTKAATMK